ncbi:MAG: amino acid racemase [Cytophagales bacterium]|nr:amino acid racemase [Armatimonadota bacterium]
MKTIGLIGGLSWESTAVYYKMINEQVRERRGGLCSAPILLHSFDFAEIVRLQQDGAWNEAAQTLARAGRQLCDGGAGCLAICTNTMHKVAAEVAEAAPSGIPLLHIGDAVGAAVRAAGIERVALLGTRYTMEQPFLADYLRDRYALSVLIPSDGERDAIHNIIFEELCRGIVRAESRQCLKEIALRLRQEKKAEGVVLGCTELMLLIGEDTGSFPLRRFDTTALHASAIVEFALASAPAETVHR